ncbi:MAG: hypothetical protein HQK83_06280 [Fibrobacteria bacterium]|nr:hypothetical protein [Fibrobacteria bacterium]
MGYCLAEDKHDTQLRSILRDAPMPGPVRIAYCREPNYFLGTSVCSKESQTLIYENQGTVEAMSCRSLKPMFINGEQQNFGYLSGLRLNPTVRNTMVLGRGYKALKALHNDGNSLAYLSTITRDNIMAKKILTSKRAGLPVYHDLGQYTTFCVLFNRFRKYKSGQYRIVQGGEVPLETITLFLREQGKNRQFYPCYQPEDFNSSYLRDFRREDLYLAMKGQEIIGVVGAWDQSGFKQFHIHGYSPVVKMTKPVVNTFLRLFGFSSFPEPGSTLRQFTLSFVCIKDENPDILASLLQSVYQDKQKQGYHSFLCGFHEKDSLQKVLKPFFSIRYHTTLYLVYWPDKGGFNPGSLDGRLPYLELAAL